MSELKSPPRAPSSVDDSALLLRPVHLEHSAAAYDAARLPSASASVVNRAPNDQADQVLN